MTVLSRRWKWTMALVAVAAMTLPARAEAIVLFNTGVDGTGLPLPVNASDPNWTIVSGPGITTPIAAVVVSTQNPAGQYAQSQDSRWIWADSSGSGATNSPYVFHLEFDLTGYDPDTAVLSGMWAVDNTATMLLNGAAPVGSGVFSLPAVILSNHNSFHAFSISGGFVSGINSIDLRVVDDRNPGGLNITGLLGVAAAVPEPTSSALMAMGFIALLAFASRKIDQRTNA
jgi:hypothetical protein